MEIIIIKGIFLKHLYDCIAKSYPSVFALFRMCGEEEVVIINLTYVNAFIKLHP